jgi:transcriptional regulator with XRE-family HTH domain
MYFRSQLQHIMKQQNISAAELSRRTGIPRQTISDWLNRAEMHTLKQIVVAASALNVSLDRLICGTDHLTNAKPLETPVPSPQQHIVTLGIGMPQENASALKQQ